MENNQILNPAEKSLFDYIFIKVKTNLDFYDNLDKMPKIYDFNTDIINSDLDTDVFIHNEDRNHKNIYINTDSDMKEMKYKKSDESSIDLPTDTHKMFTDIIYKYPKEDVLYTIDSIYNWDRISNTNPEKYKLYMQFVNKVDMLIKNNSNFETSTSEYNNIPIQLFYLFQDCDLSQITELIQMRIILLVQVIEFNRTLLRLILRYTLRLVYSLIGKCDKEQIFIKTSIFNTTITTGKSIYSKIKNVPDMLTTGANTVKDLIKRGVDNTIKFIKTETLDKLNNTIECIAPVTVNTVNEVLSNICNLPPKTKMVMLSYEDTEIGIPEESYKKMPSPNSIEEFKETISLSIQARQLSCHVYNCFVEYHNLYENHYCSTYEYAKSIKDKLYDSRYAKLLTATKITGLTISANAIANIVIDYNLTDNLKTPVQVISNLFNTNECISTIMTGIGVPFISSLIAFGIMYVINTEWYKQYESSYRNVDSFKTVINNEMYKTITTEMCSYLWYKNDSYIEKFKKAKSILALYTIYTFNYFDKYINELLLYIRIYDILFRYEKCKIGMLTDTTSNIDTNINDDIVLLVKLLYLVKKINLSHTKRCSKSIAEQHIIIGQLTKNPNTNYDDILNCKKPERILKIKNILHQYNVTQDRITEIHNQLIEDPLYNCSESQSDNTNVTENHILTSQHLENDDKMTDLINKNVNINQDNPNKANKSESEPAGQLLLTSGDKPEILGLIDTLLYTMLPKNCDYPPGKIETRKQTEVFNNICSILKKIYDNIDEFITFLKKKNLEELKTLFESLKIFNEETPSGIHVESANYKSIEWLNDQLQSYQVEMTSHIGGKTHIRGKTINKYYTKKNQKHTPLSKRIRNLKKHTRLSKKRSNLKKHTDLSKKR